MTAVRISQDGLEQVGRMAAKTGATRSEVLRMFFAVGTEHAATVERRLRQLVKEVNDARTARGRPPRRLSGDDPQ